MVACAPSVTGNRISARQFEALLNLRPQRFPLPASHLHRPAQLIPQLPSPTRPKIHRILGSFSLGHISSSKSPSSNVYNLIFLE